MSVTIYDLAKRSGLSKSTVSGCLGDKPGYSSRTKSRVRHLARKLGYQPSYLAKALVGARTNTLGILCDSPSALSMSYLWGIKRQCVESGYHPYVLFVDRYEAHWRTDAAEELLRRHFDGILVYTHEALTGRLLDLLHQSTVPVVYLRTAPPGADWLVPVERYAAVRALAAHLRGLGHRSATMVWFATPAEIPVKQVYRQAFADEGLPLVIDRQWEYDHQPAQAQSHAAAAHRLVRRRLAEGEAPTAICTIDDEVAMGVIAAARAEGLEVPGDLSVAGKDDAICAEFVHPPLTTIREPGPAAGVAALQLLLQRIADPQAELEIPAFQAELMVRQTTGPCRTRS